MRGLGWPLTRGIGQWQPARTLTTAPISSSEGWNIIGDNISQVLMAQNTIPISRCEFQGYYHCLTFWPSLLQIVVFGILKGYKPQYHHHGVLVPEQQAAALCPCGSFVHTWKKQGRAPLRSWPASPCQSHKHTTSCHCHQCLCYHGCGGQKIMEGLLNTQTWIFHEK